MLAKLLKYELKANVRTFIPLFIAILLCSITTGIFIKVRSEMATVISGTVLFGLGVALGVILLMVIIQRFHNNLLQDEGYLMFTLPVKTSSLIWSKVWAACIWLFFATIVALICFVCFCLISIGDELVIPWTEIKQALAQLEPSVIMPAVLFGLNAIAEFVSFLFTVYVSMAIAQIPRFAAKNRILVAFVVFVLINIAFMIATSLFAFSPIIESISLSVNGTMTAMLLVNVVIIAVFYFITNYILKNRLNLE